MSMRYVTNSVSVIDLGATLIGVVHTDEGAVLIDTGMTSRHAKIIEKALKGLPVAAILHTHFHADHIGGSKYFTDKYGIRAFMPAGELSFALNPTLNPSLLYGGAPLKEYRQPFLLAEAFPAEPIGHGPLKTLHGITAIDTKGHSAGHTAYLADGVLFAGDAVTSPHVIDKHGILYTFSPSDSLDTLERLKNTDFQTAALCHKEVVDKAAFCVYIDNQAAHMKKLEMLVTTAVEGCTAEEITLAAMKRLMLEITPTSWLLGLSTVKGYLTGMEGKGTVISTFDNGIFRWHRL